MNINAILPTTAFPSAHDAWKQYQPNTSFPLLPIGAPRVDERLHGGITQAGLHEFFGGAKADAHVAATFALLLAWRLPDSDAGIFWISGDKERQTSGRLYPLGLSAMGGNPSRICLVQTTDLRDALRAAADAIRSKAASAVILETNGNARLVDLTSTRRLALAAAENGVLALLVRGDAVPMPSAASTRWQICAAPSVPLAGNAPGLPTFDINLLRHRGGTAPFAARVTWDHATRSFFDTALSSGLSTPITDAEVDPQQRFRA
jgi:protein ImuA